MYQLGLYEKALPSGLSWRSKLELTRKAGFDWLEMSVDETDDKLSRLNWNGLERSVLLRDMDETGVRIYTMCLSGHRRFPLGSRDAETRQRSLDVMHRAVELAAGLGIRIIQLAGYDVYYEEGGEDTRLWFRENLAKCAEFAAEKGVILGFETMETPFMDTVEKAMRYVSEINSPYLGVYPDVGNLTNAAKLYGGAVTADLEAGRGHIFAAHLKETVPGVYRDMVFGTGHTNYPEAVKVLYSQGVRMFTGEFWYKGEENWREIVSNAAVFLRENIEQGIELYKKEVGI